MQISSFLSIITNSNGAKIIPPPSFIITLQIGTKGSNSQIALKYNSRLVIDVDTIMVWHTNLAIFDLILIQHKWKLSKTNENLYNAKKKNKNKDKIMQP